LGGGDSKRHYTTLKGKKQLIKFPRQYPLFFLRKIGLRKGKTFRIGKGRAESSGVRTKVKQGLTAINRKFELRH
jgi:hypothetical protein